MPLTSFPLRHAARRALFGVFARVRRRGGRRTKVLGIALDIPAGVHHPGLDPSSGFFHRTVGPMIAPGQRVLDVGCGAGLGALVAATRGAAVLALDAAPTALEATAANARSQGIAVVASPPEPGQLQTLTGQVPDALADPAVVGSDPWDLVLWNAPQRTESHRAAVLDALPTLPTLLGESGRLLLLVEKGSGLEDRVRAAMPFEYRVVELARDLGLRPAFRVLCLGFDKEASRARRHAERKRTKAAKAAVSRRKWEGKGENPAAPAPSSDEPVETQP